MIRPIDQTGKARLSPRLPAIGGSAAPETFEYSHPVSRSALVECNKHRFLDEEFARLPLDIAAGGVLAHREARD